LELNMRSGLLDHVTYRRQRAVLLTARALEMQETDRDNATAAALEAVKLAPTLVPAVALAGALLAEAGDLRKAGRMIERAWKANPHPDLAETYAHLRFGDSARDRLVRVELLAQKAPGDIESALAVARAALDAREFSKARTELAPFLTKPSQRVALLMAEIEEVEHGDEGRAREWTARAVHAARDPAWTADGLVSERWLPVSPISGRLDAFQWKVPLAELAGPDVRPGDVSDLPAVTNAGAAEPRPAMAQPPDEDKPPEQNAPTPPARESMPASARRPRKPKIEAVIPLLHVPDDPGPEVDAEPEPVPEKPPEGWDKLRHFFK
jgi:HemY protein